MVIMQEVIYSLIRVLLFNFFIHMELNIIDGDEDEDEDGLDAESESDVGFIITREKNRNN